MASGAPTTPGTKSQTLPPDTVPFPRWTSQSGYCTGDLNEGHRAVLLDLKRYLRIPYATLICSSIGPEPPEFPQIRQQLKEKVLSTHALSTSPSKSSSSETEAFGPLSAVIKEIFVQVPEFPFSFHASPHITPFSTRDNMSRPDAYIARRELKKQDIHWFDVAIPFEFKKVNNHTERLDNERKMIWSLHNIMREDPLRRFAFGITVEDRKLRLWLSNRAFLAVSESIDFIEDIDQVISLFYSIGCKEDVHLGWDNTVERKWDRVASEIQYVFTTCGKRFTTVRPLATYGADAMVGRGTRVFLAKDDQGNKVAIKDSWRDSDREPEGTILQRVLQDIRAEFGEEAKEAEKYFVRVRLYEDVVVAEEIDKTLILKNEDVKWMTIEPDFPFPQKLHTSSIGDVPDSGVPRSTMRRVPHQSDTIPCRTHTRTIFEDVGTSLYDLRGLTNNFLCLSHAGKALYYMHRAGWVHRDFSVANVLWVEVDEERHIHVGKLGDFEYAKKVDSEISHEARTGTMHFMAVEVADQCYLYLPRDAPSTPSFRMNFLHDLESQWWAAMWTLFYFTDTNSSSEDLDAQLALYNNAFPNAISQTSRRNFFDFRHIRQSALEKLSSSYKDRCQSVVDLASALQDSYCTAEKMTPYLKLDGELMEDIHRKVSDAYDETLKQLEKSNFQLWPLYDALKEKRRNLDDSPSNRAAKKVRRER